MLRPPLILVLQRGAPSGGLSRTGLQRLVVVTLQLSRDPAAQLLAGPIEVRQRQQPSGPPRLTPAPAAGCGPRDTCQECGWQSSTQLLLIAAVLETASELTSLLETMAEHNAQVLQMPAHSTFALDTPKTPEVPEADTYRWPSLAACPAGGSQSAA